MRYDPCFVNNIFVENIKAKATPESVLGIVVGVRLEF